MLIYVSCHTSLIIKNITPLSPIVTQVNRSNEMHISIRHSKLLINMLTPLRLVKLYTRVQKWFATPPPPLSSLPPPPHNTSKPLFLLQDKFRQSCAKMFWKTFFPSFPVFFPLPPLAMLIILTALPCATQK